MSGAAAVLAASGVVAVVAASAGAGSQRFVGVRQRGEIGARGEVDRYRFRVTAGTRVFFDADRVEGECGRNWTFTWSLVSARRRALVCSSTPARSASRAVAEASCGGRSSRSSRTRRS